MVPSDPILAQGAKENDEVEEVEEEGAPPCESTPPPPIDEEEEEDNEGLEEEEEDEADPPPPAQTASPPTGTKWTDVSRPLFSFLMEGVGRGMGAEDETAPPMALPTRTLVVWEV